MSYHANLENEEREKEIKKGGEEEEKNEGKKILQATHQKQDNF